MEDHGRFQDGSDTASHMADTPEKPSMAWQTLLRALLEGEHSSWKSYLVCSPGFTGQGFILILKTSCFKSFASFWPSFISCLWTHIATLLIQTDILLQTKGSAVTPTLQISIWVNEEPPNAEMTGKWHCSGKGKDDNLYLLLWTNPLQGCSFGSQWERQGIHKLMFQLTLLIFQRLITETKRAYSWWKLLEGC